MPFSIKALLVGIAIFVGLNMFAASLPAVPDRPAPGMSARTQITVVIPADISRLQNHRLEVVLNEVDPGAPGKESVIDRHTANVSHNNGAVTMQSVSVGAAATVKPGKLYFVSVALFQVDGRRSHLGEVVGKRGAAFVLRDGRPNQITMTIRRATHRDSVLEIADEIRKGNDVKATKLAQSRAKDFDDLYDIMNLYRARKIGGMGWGPTPIPSGVQDGLEVTLISLSRAVPANFAQDDQANIEAAYWVAAIAELTIARDSGFKPVGNKTKADWHQKASLVRLEALRFAKAAASKDAKVIQTSAKAITNACNQCHEVYRD